MAKQKKTSPDSELLLRVKDRYKQASDATEDQRSRALEELAFCDPENQWDEADKQARRTKGRPCLVVDRMSPFIDQIANDQRQNRPALQVHPVDDQADEETAKVINGILKHIQYDSNADVAYDTASLSQIRCGFGFIRAHLEYCNEDSFDQDIKIDRVPNPFTVFIDPTSMEPDGSDMSWAMLTKDLTEDEYKGQFPDSDLARASASTWRSLGNEYPGWISSAKKSVRVIEYFERIITEETIYSLPDGTVVAEKDLPAEAKPTKKRTTARIEIKQYVLNAVEKLAETTFPGRWIPVFPVYGQELIIDGERQYSGLVRRMMDVQKMVNYWKTAQTEMIALAPKSPWIGPRGFRGDMEREWAVANTANQSTLEYEPVVIQGQVMPPPMRNVQEPAIGAITAALGATEEDLKAVTGLYDPTLGNRANSDQSGVAIRQLQHQGQMGNFHFPDNMNRTMRHIGKFLVEVIRLVYDTARAVRMIGEDDQHTVVKINEETKDPKTGEPVLYDMSVGTYDVVAAVGPSYATKRQENMMAMLDMMKTIPPEQAALITDLLVRQMDTPIANEIADRLTPSQFKNQKGQPQIPPEVQAQMQQMQQMLQILGQQHDALVKELERTTQELESKRMDLESKERIALDAIHTALLVAELKAQSAEAITGLQEELAFIKHRMTTLLEAQPEPAGATAGPMEAV